MNHAKLTAMLMAGLMSACSWTAFAQSSGDGAPVDKGGMPPSTEMNADKGPENALPPGTIGGGNGGDASGSSTSPGTGSSTMSGGNTMGSGSGSGSGSGGAGSSGGSGGGTGSAGGGTGKPGGGTGG